ncbi:MAG: LPS export ABC transporter periplasmic protein LptC [Candidatus Omnitrophica bacterium]|nr:LPS export ABC transporter periplasmic protein LptC [Candidatus Omnitrophota bacterium]
MIFRTFLTAAAAVFCVIVFGTDAYSRSGGDQDAQQQIRDFSISGFGEKGKKDWDLAGKSADITNDEVIKLNSIEGNFYSDNDEIKLTADKGDFDKSKDTVHLEDNVIVTTASGTRMTTDSLNWDRKAQLLETRDIVNIERSNMTATSVGASGRPDMNRVNLEKDVVVKIDNNAVETKKEESLKEIVITCDGPLEVDYQNNMATFKNNVIVDMKDSNIKSDTMDVYFSRNKEAKPQSPGPGSEMMGNQIDRIVARGNVRIFRGENVSYSDEAVYSSATRKITLSGKPRLVLFTSKDVTEGLSEKSAPRIPDSPGSQPSVKNDLQKKAQAIAQSLDAVASGKQQLENTTPDFDNDRSRAIEAALSRPVPR